MTDCEAPHYLVDLDLDCVADFGVSHKDNKSFHSGNAVAFTGNVLNIDVVLFPTSTGAGVPIEDRPSS